ncbi:MAG: hypothetical protein Q7R77_00300 [Candidatus Daviesbacteria bacterium]|nr:hypothetical protein [Candidatus Daviesbacteria bacterium]
MKKLAFIGSVVVSFLNPVKILAATPDITIEAPVNKLTNKPLGYSNLGIFISNAISLIFIFAVIMVLIMLIWGAFEWIASGGDKEAVGKARNRILNALIGMAVLAVAFAIFKVAGQFLGFDTLNFVIPTP